MRFYGSTFFADNSPEVEISHNRNSYNWDVTLKISSNQCEKERNQTIIFLKNLITLHEFVANINKAYEQLLEPSKEAKDA
jgi:hypothetical protein